MKKLVRKTAALLLTAALCVPFAACGGGEEEQSEQKAIYLSYVAYAEALGEEPMSYEDWLASIKGEQGDQGAQGEPGENGLSAYEIYVKYHPDYTGDEEEWLESLKGDKGEDGADGEDGDNGLSAYEIYVKYHPDYTGDEQAWLESLKGEPGKDGDNGLSAYEIYVKYHPDYTGDEQAWLESLKGEPGKDGDNGSNGLSAYEIYVKYHPDYEGTEEEWSNDLAYGRLVKYTVNFCTTEGTKIASQTVYYGKTVTAPAVPDGYLGYYLDETGSSKFNTAEGILSDQTVYAVPISALGDYVGSGTEEDPYIILTANGLQTFATNVNAGTDNWASAYVELGCDIDLSSVASWTPIGTNTSPFSGNFNGDYHKISNMKITAFAAYTGLFGYTASTGVQISNLRMVAADISFTAEAAFYSGFVVGYVGGTSTLTKNSIIRNVSVDSTSKMQITHTTAGTSNVGGIVGYGYYWSTIIAAHVSAQISVTSSFGVTYIGGVCGYAYGYDSTSRSDGIFVSIFDGTLNVTNTATSVGYIGGIVGYDRTSRSYRYIYGNLFSGNINVLSHAASYVAGIAGSSDSDAHLYCNLSTGNISAAANADDASSVNCKVAWIAAYTEDGNNVTNKYSNSAVLSGTSAEDAKPTAQDLSWFYVAENVNGLFTAITGSHANYIATTFPLAEATSAYVFSGTALPTLAWEAALTK